MPNFAEGYCTDDNARALVLALMLQRLGHGSPRLGAHAATYAAFLNHAFDRKRGRFRNFMSFDRRWLEEVGSEDCQGHALWALGLCVSQAGQGSFQMLAAQLFEQALPVAAEFSSPRAWAFTLIGIDEYLRRFSGDRRANQIRNARHAADAKLWRHRKGRLALVCAPVRRRTAEGIRPMPISVKRARGEQIQQPREAPARRVAPRAFENCPGRPATRTVRRPQRVTCSVSSTSAGEARPGW